MNDMIKKQLDHRTIRFFKDKSVSDDVLSYLYDVANMTPSSVGLQGFSIVRITDKTKKKAIAKIGGQDYIAMAPELFIFVVDYYRNARIMQDHGSESVKTIDMDKFFQGVTDTVLGAQNVYNALESLDLGGVFLGSILNDIPELIKILELPKFTFPILGLAFGYPNDNPTKKPRLDVKMKVFENKYNVFDDYMSKISEYDVRMSQYYDTRNPSKTSDKFSVQVAMRLAQSNKMRARIFEFIQSQGFEN